MQRHACLNSWGIKTMSLEMWRTSSVIFMIVLAQVPKPLRQSSSRKVAGFHGRVEEWYYYD